MECRKAEDYSQKGSRKWNEERPIITDIKARLSLKGYVDRLRLTARLYIKLKDRID